MIKAKVIRKRSFATPQNYGVAILRSIKVRKPLITVLSLTVCLALDRLW